MKNEERVTVTRAKLIDAAIAALAEIGYHRTTFVEVSRRSELSRGAIHHHFDSIPDLMTAVARDLGGRIREDVMLGLQDVPKDGDLYEAGIDFVWDQMRSPNNLALAQIRSAVTTDPELREAVAGEVIAAAEWLHEQARCIVSVRVGAENLSPGIVGVMLTALAGAATSDAAIGAPADDPERVEYRNALKRMMKLAIAERKTEATA